MSSVGSRPTSAQVNPEAVNKACIVAIKPKPMNPAIVSNVAPITPNIGLTTFTIIFSLCFLFFYNIFN
ncbi:MAG: hypothetical protein E3J90_06015 [Promethearchaeota archaeon]|nr:MAG: hypothetical protein E3J90_06015 [Candidatus Lokiarchaeota archaeon]